MKWSRSVYFNIRYRLNKWADVEGVWFPVNLEYGYDVLRFIHNGEYESGEINIIKHTLAKEDTVLELGTGLGFISAYCSKRIGSDRVYTFEANQRLERNIRELYERNEVSPHLEFAILGRNEGVRTFYRNKESLLASGLQGDGIRNNQAMEVREKNLNTMIARIRPTYLIMDIEGGEYAIFEDIDFQTITKVQFELHPGILDSSQVDAIFGKLTANGFVKDGSFNDENNNFYFFK